MPTYILPHFFSNGKYLYPDNEYFLHFKSYYHLKGVFALWLKTKIRTKTENRAKTNSRTNRTRKIRTKTRTTSNHC